MLRAFPFLWAVPLLLAACGEAPTSSDPNLPPDTSGIELLLQGWTHSYEEQESSDRAIELYRPSGSRDFPSSWFRHSYSFEADGTCLWRVLHPTDAHYMEPARWSRDEEDPSVISIRNPLSVEVVRFRILEIDTDLMRIESLKYYVPRCNYRHGQVDVWFETESGYFVSKDFLDRLHVAYTFLLKGQVSAKMDLRSGDPQQLKDELESRPDVDRVSTGGRTSGDTRIDVLYIQFAAGVSRDEAITVLRSLAEFGAFYDLQRAGVAARLQVPVGLEDGWVRRLEESPLVYDARKTGLTCPE